MNRPANLLALALLLLASALIGYRIIWLKYPIFPAAPQKVWRLSMEGRVSGGENETTLMVGLPFTQRGQTVAEERIHSGTLAFNLVREGPNQIGVWSGVVSPGGEVIGYSGTIQVRPSPPTKAKTAVPYPLNIQDKEQALAKRLVEKWDFLQPSDRLRRIAAGLRGTWGSPPLENRDIKEWSAFQDKRSLLDTALLLLRAAGLSAEWWKACSLLKAYQAQRSHGLKYGLERSGSCSNRVKVRFFKGPPHFSP